MKLLVSRRGQPWTYLVFHEPDDHCWYMLKVLTDVLNHGYNAEAHQQVGRDENVRSLAEEAIKQLGGVVSEAGSWSSVAIKSERPIERAFTLLVNNQSGVAIQLDRQPITGKGFWVLTPAIGGQAILGDTRFLVVLDAAYRHLKLP